MSSSPDHKKVDWISRSSNQIKTLFKGNRSSTTSDHRDDGMSTSTFDSARKNQILSSISSPLAPLDLFSQLDSLHNTSTPPARSVPSPPIGMHSNSNAEANEDVHPSINEVNVHLLSSAPAPSPSNATSRSDAHIIGVSSNAPESVGRIVHEGDTSTRIKDSLVLASGISQIAIQKFPDVISTNPIKALLSVAKMILEIKDAVGENKDALSRDLRKTTEILENMSQIVQSGVSNEVRLEIDEYKTKISRQYKTLDQIAQKVGTIQRFNYITHKKEIEEVSQQVNAITNGLVTTVLFKIRNTTIELREAVENVERLSAELKEMISNETKRKLGALQPSMNADHRSVFREERAGQKAGIGRLLRRACVEGTRLRILEEITQWANGADDTLPAFWLTGQAGSGKTTIMYTIARKFETGQTTKFGASFLCSRQFDGTRRVRCVLPTIAYQLACECAPYGKVLCASNIDMPALILRDIPEQLEKLIVEPWRKCVPDSTYLVVIDALDELDDNDAQLILQCLLNTINEQPGLQGLKFLFSSRTEPDIERLSKSFSRLAVFRLQDVAMETASLDIKLYLEEKLPALANQPEVSILVQRAQGLFIYASTIVVILTKHPKITAHSQLKALRALLAADSNRLPSIEELYQHVLESAFSQFHDSDLPMCLDILHTILCAAERVSPSLVTSLLGIDDDEIVQNLAEALHAVLYIQNGRIFWYHASFPDFVLSNPLSHPATGTTRLTFRCYPSNQHTTIAERCFQIMQSPVSGLRFNIGDISSSFMMDRDQVKELSYRLQVNISPVLKYSCAQWAYHTHLSSKLNPKIPSLIASFLKLSVLFWLEAMNLLGTIHHCYPMLQRAREWVSDLQLLNTTTISLLHDLQETSDFVTYFSSSPASESTPHLYLSSLATWNRTSLLSKTWKSQFLRIPSFTPAWNGSAVPLMTIQSSLTEPSVIGFSRDGTKIVAASGSNFETWDAATGRQFISVKDVVENDSLHDLRDIDWYASADNSAVKVWDVTTGKCLKVLEGDNGEVTAVAFLNGDRSQWIAAGYDNGLVHLWDTSTSASPRVLSGHHQTIRSLSFSVDGLWIASGSVDRDVRIWSVSTAVEVRVIKAHRRSVRSVVFAECGPKLVTGSHDATVRQWDATTGEMLLEFNAHFSRVLSVAISGNGELIASSFDDYTVEIYDASDGTLMQTITVNDDVKWMSFSKDDRRLLLGSETGCINVWDVSTRTGDAKVARGNTQVEIHRPCVSNDGSRLLSHQYGGSLHIWDTCTQQKLNTLEGREILDESILFFNNGKSIGWLENLQVWFFDLESESLPVKVVDLGEYFARVAISEDGTMVATYGNREATDVYLWTISKSVKLYFLTGHQGEIHAVSFSPGDGKQLVSRSHYELRIWDVSTAQLLKVISTLEIDIILEPDLLLLSDSGTQIISNMGEDFTVAVWDLSTGLLTKRLDSGHKTTVTSIAMNGNETHIVSASYDRTVRVYCVKSGEEIRAFQGRHADSVKSVAFLQGGQSIISASSDGSVVVWELEEPMWYLAETNWITSTSSTNRLMWVPPEANVIARPNCRIVFGESHYSTVVFDNSSLGPSWVKCYTGQEVL